MQDHILIKQSHILLKEAQMSTMSFTLMAVEQEFLSVNH